MSRRQRGRKAQQRIAHQLGVVRNRPHRFRDYNGMRGVDARDIYVDVLFGVKPGRLDA